MRLTLSPEFAHVDPRRRLVDHSHPGAVAFAVIGNAVALAPRSTHAVIFNALKAVATPQAASPIVRHVLEESGPQAVYRDYGVKFVPNLPSTADLRAFAGVNPTLTARRSATLAGRAWSPVGVGGRTVGLISWWVSRSLVYPTISLVVDALGFSGEVLLEFQDSKLPESRRFQSKHG